MKIVLVGHFESAFVRMHDQEVRPDRNATGHGYYLDLNRNTNKTYRDGASTFVALAQGVIVPWELDWDGPELPEKFGITKTPYAKQEPEWQHQSDVVDKFLAEIAGKEVLSGKAISHITGLDFSGYDDEIASKYVQNKPPDRSSLISLYLRRLISQIYSARAQDTYLLVAEPEIQIIADLGAFLGSGQFPYEMPFPDLRGKLIDTETLLDGVLSFSPPNVSSLEAVRRDSGIQHYARRIRDELKSGDAADITRATVEAYRTTEVGKKTDKIFEVLTWVAKPLHYIPGLDAVMTVAEDLKDAANQAAKWKMRYSDWHLIGIKMQTIAVEDFLQRLSNRYPE
jgi:hypothetical protein